MSINPWNRRDWSNHPKLIYPDYKSTKSIFPGLNLNFSIILFSGTLSTPISEDKTILSSSEMGVLRDTRT